MFGGGQPVEMVGAQAGSGSDANLIDKHGSDSGQAVSSAESVLRAAETREQAGNRVSRSRVDADLSAVPVAFEFHYAVDQ